MFGAFVTKVDIFPYSAVRRVWFRTVPYALCGFGRCHTPCVVSDGAIRRVVSDGAIRPVWFRTVLYALCGVGRCHTHCVVSDGAIPRVVSDGAIRRVWF